MRQIEFIVRDLYSLRLKRARAKVKGEGGAYIYKYIGATAGLRAPRPNKVSLAVSQTLLSQLSANLRTRPILMRAYLCPKRKHQRLLR